MGRPSIYTEAIADAICERLMEGESLRRICLDEQMPNRATVIRWQSSDESFATKCACARVMQADLMDDKVLDVAQKVEDGTMDPKAGSVVLSAYQWRASKLAPKKYGDKISAELSGPDGRKIPLSLEIDM